MPFFLAPAEGWWPSVTYWEGPVASHMVGGQYSTVKYSSVQYSTVQLLQIKGEKVICLLEFLQCSTVLNSTVHTVLYNTVQYYTVLSRWYSPVI